MASHVPIALAAVALAWLPVGGEASAAPEPSPTTVDVRRGSVAGGTLGSSRGELEATFGPPLDQGRMLPNTPDGVSVEEIGLPWTLGPLPGVNMAKTFTMRYRGMTVDLAPSKGAYVFYVWRPRARTRGGVQIGDSLESVASRHPSLRCGVRNQNSEYVSYPYCKGRIGRTHVWFGQDPVRSITISRASLH